MLVACERWVGDGDRLLYWPRVLLTIAALLPHLGWGCSTVGHWGPKALCLPLSLTSASSLQRTQAVCVLVISLFNAHRCSSAYLHMCISWLTARSRVNMLQVIWLLQKQNAKMWMLNVHQKWEGWNMEKMRIWRENIEIIFEEELTLLKKLKVTMMISQRKRALVRAVRTVMNMKRELMKLLQIKK